MNSDGGEGSVPYLKRATKKKERKFPIDIIADCWKNKFLEVDTFLFHC